MLGKQEQEPGWRASEEEPVFLKQDLETSVVCCLDQWILYTHVTPAY